MNETVTHFFDWIIGVQTQKHLQGKHDQKTHGHRMGMRALSNHLYNLIQEKGGFTYRPRKGSRTRGISVSIEGFEEPIPAAKLSRNKILKYVRRVMATIQKDRRNHLGAWVTDTPNGKLVVLDVSRVFTDETVARKHGNQWHQQSIYNMTTGELIELNADEGRIAAAAAGG